MDTDATVDTSGGAGGAITVTGDGNLSFTNLVGGAISGATNGLNINAGNGLAYGSVTVNTTQSILGGGFGILARNYGIGALTITAANVTGTTGRGIDARNNNAASTDLTVTATGAVSGDLNGIYARNGGIGALTVNAADVTATIGIGIIARNDSGTDLTVTTTSTVSGNSQGIYARNDGTGALTITAANVTGTATRGIYARSVAGGSVITVSGAVTGGTEGIGVRGAGSNVINVAAGATVTGGTSAIDTTINAQASNDVINNLAGGTITGNLLTGGGGDIFANDGTFTGNANLGGGNNIVTNTSLLSFTGDLTTGAGNDTVTNTGAWTGNVDLGGGVNAFNNNAGGIFNVLATVNVGAGNAVNNAGTLSPGGTGTLQTTTLTGNFVQSGTGTFAVDLNDGAGTADRLNVSGTANLAGAVGVNLFNLSTGQGAATVLSAAGGTTGNGLTASGGVALNPTLTYPNANDVVLNYSADFTPASLTGTQTPNQLAVGNNLNTVLTAGSGGMAAILTDLLGITDVAAYLAALDRLHGEHYLTQTALLLGSSYNFTETLLSCPSRLDGAAVRTAQDKCLWARVDGRTVEIDRSNSNVGGDEDVWGFSGGYEAPLNETGRAGLAFSIQSTDLDTNNAASSDGTKFTIGGKVEKTFGVLEASAGIYGGVAAYDTTRRIGLGGLGTAAGDHDIGFGGVVGRISHAYETDNFRIVPMLDVAASYVSFGGLNETGAGRPI